MRKTFMVVVVVAAVFAIAVVPDGHNLTSKTLLVQGIDNVVSAQLIPAHGGAGATALMLDAHDKQDKEVIAKVLKWIQVANVVGNAAHDQFVSLGGNPTSFGIGFITGESIRILDAVGSVSRKLDNGSIEVHSDSIPNQVTVFEGNKRKRIDSPELKAWIEEGWQQEEAFLFTPEEAIAKVLKEHPEFPPTTSGVNQVYEDIGGDHGHKQPVTLTTKVELNYIVTLTKDYNLHVGDTEAIQYWVYSVEHNSATLIDKQGNVPTIK